MAQSDAKKFAEMSKSGGDSAGKKDKKKQDKPKAAEKKEKPAAAQEEAPLEKPKEKDPFAAMPKGNWDMDDFKRFYSNNDEDKSVPYFWEKFDKENYSIWYSEYEYAEDLSKIFMTCNLIGGMFQRVDKLRKNAFASVGVFGEDGNNNISGIWVWRGHELCFPLNEDWTVDYESYDWKKLDADAPETKKLVDQYFKWV